VLARRAAATAQAEALAVREDPGVDSRLRDD
jgi:hypothetical protein